MRCSIILFLMMLVLSGCAKVYHLNRLLTLDGYARNIERQTSFVEAQDASFAKLVATIRAGDLDNFRTRANFRKAFGEPVFSRAHIKDGILYDQWLYRRALGSIQDRERVYLYFSEEGILLDWEYFMPQGGDLGNSV